MLTDDDKIFLKRVTEPMNVSSINKSLERAVRENRTNFEKRGKLSKEEVKSKADRIFNEELYGLNNWDRRRILQRIEKLNQLHR